MTPARIARHSSVIALLLMLALACRKGDIQRSGHPDTFISFEAINLSGENRLNSEVRLSWYGTAADAVIEGFEISLDNQNWNYTTRNDSVFVFDIPPGEDSTDITFYVRAIDNYERVDPTPALLIVPLKNSPPVAAFIDERGPGDTAFIAASFFWAAGDPDGDNTIENVEIRLNDGPWYSLDLRQNLISLVAEDGSGTSGTASAQVYYGTSTAPAPALLEGLRLNDSNLLMIRASDIAKASSEIDTAPAFFYRTKNPQAQVLWLSGHGESISGQYKELLDSAGLRYDRLDFGRDQGRNIPSFIDPTAHLIFKAYDQAFLNLPTTLFRNPINGVESTLLDALAPIIQRFTDDGKKYFLTTNFTSSTDLSVARDVYPVSAAVLSTQPGSQARITTDSSLVPLLSGNYPLLSPTNVEFGVVPMLPSNDAQAFYRAQLTRFRGWNGSSDVVAAVRRRQGRISEVFFAQEIHRYQRNSGAVRQLIDEIFNNEF